MNFFKILRYLQSGDKFQFDVPVEEQKSYLESLGNPKDDIDRSFKQYLCQQYFVSKGKKTLFNTISFVLFVPVLLFLTAIRLFVTRKCTIEALSESTDAEVGIIPSELLERYHPNNKVWGRGLSLSIRDWGIIFLIAFKYFSSPYFSLKCMLNIAKYSSMIKRYNPSVLMAENECSFSSSVLTYYCSIHGIKHINIMHGEKLFFIRDSFFHFDECYVWDEHYKNLFIELKADPSQFIICMPPYIKMDLSNHNEVEAYADYKYYLAHYSEEQLKSIVQSMDFAKKAGKTVKYRPHPRYSNLEILRACVREDEIEYPNQVSIIQSLANMKYAVGSYTTVLLQAYCSGKEVIQDDVTYKERYKQLFDMKYILAKESIPILSRFQD